MSPDIYDDDDQTLDDYDFDNSNPTILNRLKRQVDGGKEVKVKLPETKKVMKLYTEKGKLTISNPMVNNFSKFPKIKEKKERCGPKAFSSYSKKKPTKFSWKDKGYLSDVRNQGNCGACWLVNTIDMAETYRRIWHKIKLDENFHHPDDVKLAAQDILECSDSACHGK